MLGTMLKDPPTCEVCKRPMQLVQVLTAEKDGQKKNVEVYTCYRDKCFKKVER